MAGWREATYSLTSVRHAGVPVAVVDQDANMLIEQRVRIARQVRAGRRVVDLDKFGGWVDRPVGG